MKRFVAPRIERVERPGGGFIVRSEADAPPHARCLGDALTHWAHHAPERTLYAERSGDGWRRVSYREALQLARSLGQALLNLGLGPDRPLLILSGNSIDHALFALAAMHVGVPVAPLSPAYSLMSSDHAKLRALSAIVGPGAVFVSDRKAFGKALSALGLAVPVIDLSCATTPTSVDAAFSSITGDTIAKLLFTSGSTGVPKAVINTQRMLCSNQAALAAGWAFLGERPPVIVDWLPWSHTFGANHNHNLVVTHGGTLYIDNGKPAPGAFDETLRNLREVNSTIYFNVPRGFDMLVGHLETDAALRETFFKDLEVIFYAAAALSPATWQRFENVAAGRDVAMTSAWGSTETSPLVTQVSYAIDRAGVIGVPIPGQELAFVPVGDKLELRVKGPNLAPGYLRADRSVEPLPLDELGFYPMGDAGRLADDANPSAGVVFEGRIAENFKLASGTWVHVGEVRLALLAACSPLVADAVICGHDREGLGAMIFMAAGQAADRLPPLLARHAANCTSSSTRIARALILVEPASIDAGEITDKGYLNQRALLHRRADEVAKLFSDHADVVLV